MDKPRRGARIHTSIDTFAVFCFAIFCLAVFSLFYDIGGGGGGKPPRRLVSSDLEQGMIMVFGQLLVQIGRLLANGP